MGRRIQIKAGQIAVVAELNETRTSQAIWEALPIKGKGNRWGEEIYFSIPVNIGEENATEVVGVGDLAYWPPGKAFCIFFGPTPVSEGAEPRPASPVNVLGKITGDATTLTQVPQGADITVDKEE